MKFLIRSHQRSQLYNLGRRWFSTAANTQEYDKRNYANNLDEYNTVITSLTAQRRPFLLRDVFDDMMLDAVQPSRDTFHSLIVGTMKGARLQDAFFFRDQMKAMGLVPDVALYNFLISVCGKCKNSEQAMLILEEMKNLEVKPNGQTYICLLNACAAAGRLDRVYAIVRDMTAAGAGLNKYCYAGLITAHINKKPMPEDTAAKIIEFVQKSNEWSSIESSTNNAENVMVGVSEEELYNLPTAEYIHRRGGFMSRQLTIYHVAAHACANLKNVEAMDTILGMLEKGGHFPDAFILIQVIRCYLHAGDLDRGHKVFLDYMDSGKPPMIELYLTLVEGAMIGYTPKGMQLAFEALENMDARRVFLTPKMGSDLLLIAAGDTEGDYKTANYIWDLMQKNRSRAPPLSLPAVEAYYKGLKVFNIPEDDPRLMLVSRAYDNLRTRSRGGPGPRPGPAPAPETAPAPEPAPETAPAPEHAQPQ